MFILETSKSLELSKENIVDMFSRQRTVSVAFVAVRVEPTREEISENMDMEALLECMATTS